MSTPRTEAIQKNFTSRYLRQWFAGFILLGVLVGLVGSLVVAWQYHTATEPGLIGLHFLALNAGYVAAVAAAQRFLSRASIRTVALLSCLVGFGSLLTLSFLVPPALPVWRILGLAFVGCAGGGLVTALLHVLESAYAESPASATGLSGLLFGSGNLLATLIVGTTYFAGSAQVACASLALIPLVFFFVYAFNRFPRALEPVRNIEAERRARESLRKLRSVAGWLFALLLFFQFGNEWAIAGWLPLFLIHRLGSNPDWAIFALAAYFLALLFGRVMGSRVLARVNHRSLLLGSITVAIAGYLLLSFTTSMAGAWIAVAVIGLGFGPVYPLVAERLDERFSYHAGFYSGIFSIAITGAMSAPWLLGYVDAYLGMRYVMLLPAFGSIAVLILTSLIMLEAHVMTEKGEAPGEKAVAARVGKN